MIPIWNGKIASLKKEHVTFPTLNYSRKIECKFIPVLHEKTKERVQFLIEKPCSSSLFCITFWRSGWYWILLWEMFWLWSGKFFVHYQKGNYVYVNKWLLKTSDTDLNSLYIIYSILLQVGHYIKALREKLKTLILMNLSPKDKKEHLQKSYHILMHHLRNLSV